MLINNYSRSALCTIVIFLHLSTLLGMDYNTFNRTSITSEEKNNRDRVNDGFNEGILQLGLGNKKQAEAILAGAYFDGKKHGILDLIYPCQLQTVSNILYDMLSQKEYFDIAAELVISDTKKGITYRHAAQKAHVEGKFDLEKEYYAKAFCLFEQSHTIDARAKKHYEDALWCGRGYEYDPSRIKNYYLNQLQYASDIRHNYLSETTYHFANKIIKKALTKLSQLGHEDPSTQCTLAQIYLNGADGIQANHSKSLDVCRDTLYNLAVIPRGESLEIYDYLLGIISTFSKHPDGNIQYQALILEKYCTILSAIKKNDPTKLKELAELYYNNTTLNYLPLQLLCGSVNSFAIQRIENITFEDPLFIEFCNSKEGELAAHVLEWALLDMSPESEIKNLFHLMLGGYAYHCNKYSTAIDHFQKCSTYNDDFYLQALSIKANPDNCHKQLVSILPLLHKHMESSSKSKKGNAAQKIITEICDYDATAPIEDILSLCQKWVPYFAFENNSEYPFEYAKVLMGLNDLRKKIDVLAPDQSITAAKLATYFDFFSLLQANDQKGLDAFFSKKNSNVTGIRRTVLKAIRGSKNNNIQKIIFESDAFKQFCISDLSLLKIIAQIIQHPQDRFKIKPDQCYYILGGLASLQQDYSFAHGCFLFCNQNDPYVLAKLFEATPVQNMLEILNRCIPLLNSAPKNDKTEMAKTIITNIINSIHKEYVAMLLEEQKYEHAYAFAQCLAELDAIILPQVLCNVFTTIESSITQKPYDTYRELLEIPYRINAYNVIKEKATQKNHCGCFCDCTSFILNQHSECSHLESLDKLALKRECLDYLSCSLEHDNRTDPNQQQSKRSLCAHLACHFGIIEESIPLLDKAIKYNNGQALYEKANLLSRKKPINPQDLSLVIKLLEQHIVSNDSDTRRSKSYNSLGKYYRTKTDIKHQRKAFDYLKAAAALGNYNAGHLLGLYYFNGIENYQNADPEQAFLCLKKTLDLKKKNSYADALYIRTSMYYEQKQYMQAQEYLRLLLDYPGYDHSQKLYVYWLMGLVKLFLNDDMNLSEDLISYFRTAYDIANTHQASHANSLFIDNFKLSNDEKAFYIIQKNINYIIENNKTDNASLEFCAIMGVVLFQQCYTRPITDAQRQIAVKSLVHAAHNGQVEAPFSLLLISEEEVSYCDKILYLEKLSINNPALTETINDTLANVYPEDVISQSILIEHFHKKNSPIVLKKYASQLYEYKKPIVADPIGYSLFPYEKTEQLIKECLNISFLTECAEAFMKNPIKSTPLEHFIAIWRGSLLAYSLEQMELIKGASYLEMSRKYFPLLQKEHIERNLGYIYYKLGWQKHKNNNATLAIGYLKKGADLRNQNCVELLQKITPPTIATKKDDANTIAHNQNHPPLSYPVDNLEEQLELFKELIAQQKQHPDYRLLVCSVTENQITDREKYKNAVQIITSGKSATHLAQSDNSKVTLGYAIAACDDLQNNELVKQAIQNAITHGITKNNVNTNTVFKDLSILGQLCTLTDRVIKRNNNTQMTLLLGTVKRELLKNNVNIKAFERFYKAFYKINLAQNNVWKKVK